MTVATQPEEAAQTEPPETLGDSVSDLFLSIKAIARNSIRLVTLEGRLAGLSLALMVGLGVAVALLLLTAWFLLVAALTVWLASHLGWAGAMALVAVLNLAASVPLVLLIIRYSRNLLFSATRRQLLGTRQKPLVRPQAVSAS